MVAGSLESIAAGVDGCRGGWVCVIRSVKGGAPRVQCFSSVVELVSQLPRPVVLTIDVPIGLTDSGSRACDRAARALLGFPRSSSVFPAPVRATLRCETYAGACDAGMRTDGRRLSRQTWAILPKIREVDDVLRRDPHLQSWVREIHPEVSFTAWRGGEPMRHSKATLQGLAERRALVELTYGSIAPLVAALPRKHAHVDDLLDAFAALWTAERIATGRAGTLPHEPSKDAVGLRMEIVF
jgi:predicted RNase H-like nuclease